jgi:hypothetical protein
MYMLCRRTMQGAQMIKRRGIRGRAASIAQFGQPMPQRIARHDAFLFIAFLNRSLHCS